LKLIDTWLSTSAFIASEEVSIADLLAANELSQLVLINYDLRSAEIVARRPGFHCSLQLVLCSPYPKVVAWMKKMAALKHWNSVHSVINKVVRCVLLEMPVQTLIFGVLCMFCSLRLRRPNPSFR
jgi:glutathione S-transferase